MLAERTRQGPPASLPVRTRAGGGRPAREHAALGAIVVLAAAIRLATLHIQSFDNDEAVTVGLLHRSLPGMLSQIPSSEQTPPLYYIVAWLWARVFGYGEFGLRSLSAVAGTVTVPLAYAAAKTVSTRRAGLVTAALVTCNPLLFWYSQEARSYGLFVTLSAAALWMFLRALQDWRGGTLWWWALFSALSLATHYFAAFIVIPQAVWLLVTARRAGLLRPALGAICLPAAAGVALVPLAIAQRSPEKYPFTELESLSTRTLHVPREMLMGFNLPSAGAWVLAAAALFVLAAVLLIRRVSPAERWRLRPVATVIVVALVLPLLVAAAGLDVILTRNFIGVLVPILLLAGAGFAASRIGWVAAGAVCVIWLAAVSVVESDAQWQRPPWRAVATVLGRADGPRLVAVAPAALGVKPALVYLPGARILYALTTPIREIDVVAFAASGSRQRLEVEHLLPPAPGFREVTRREGDGYIVVRFQGARPWLPSVSNPVSLRTQSGELVGPPFCCAGLLQRGLASTGTLNR